MAKTRRSPPRRVPNLERVDEKWKGRRLPISNYPEGIKSSSPGLRGTSYPGNTNQIIPSTLKGLNRSQGLCGRRLMQPRWGWELFWRMTQGSPAARSNPGLNDGTPLEFKMGRADGNRWPCASTAMVGFAAVFMHPAFRSHPSTTSL